MSVLFVFLGKCLQVVCGIFIGYKDMNGELLYMGDIVQVYIEFYGFDNLIVVVGDEWMIYSNGVIECKDGLVYYFVMGIKGVLLEEIGEWWVRKVKGFEDVIFGEYWCVYGFNYQVILDFVLEVV